jgi:competence protein ComEC
MLQKYPALKLLLPFILGIIAWHYKLLNIPLWLGASILMGLLISFILFQRTGIGAQYIYNYINGIIVSIIIIFAGYFTTHYHQAYLQTSHYNQIIDSSKTYLKIALLEAPITKANSYKAEAKVLMVNNKTSHGNLYVYITQADTLPNLQAGSIIYASASILPVKNNGNPGEFNYAEFCKMKGITHIAFVKNTEYIKSKNTYQSTSVFFNKVKNKVVGIIKKYVPNTQAVGIAEALLIGDRKDIDESTWQAYSNTGIVHIIAISGMHIGFIYSNILAALGLFSFFRKRKYLAVIIAILAMWFFAGITGMPASVMRAAVLFTLLGIGTIFNKKGQELNLVSMAGFLLLCYNPNWLFDIGFLLSFAAVVGIVLFADKWYRSVYTKYAISQKAWQLITATLAAQIFTLPFCLYYFHQFPLLFIATNLFAIPLTNLVLLLDIGIVLTCALPFIPNLLGGINTAIILFLNKLISVISTWQYTAIKNIQITNVQLYLLLFCMALLCIAFLHKNTKALIVALISFILCTFISLYNNISSNKQNKLLVLQAPKSTAIDWYKGHYYTNISSQNANATTTKFIVQPSRIYQRATTNFSIPIINKHNCIITQVANKKVIVLGNNALNFSSTSNTDIVVLTQNNTTPIDSIAIYLQPKIIVADGSNTTWQTKQYKQACIELAIPFYNTAEQGAYILGL